MTKARLNARVGTVFYVDVNSGTSVGLSYTETLDISTQLGPNTEFQVVAEINIVGPNFSGWASMPLDYVHTTAYFNSGVSAVKISATQVKVDTGSFAILHTEREQVWGLATPSIIVVAGCRIKVTILG